MPALLFRDAQPAATAATNRADVVCFIGFVARRPGGTLPGRLRTWLVDAGWRARGVTVADDDPLEDTPVPIDSFEAFDRLFVWEARPTASGGFAFPTWLGAAVRSFFRQGGSRCFVVRTGDPGPYDVLPEHAPASVRAARLADRARRRARLLPGLPGGDLPPPSRQDPSTWRGLGVLLGLPEAAFACLPDLPELVADAALEPTGLAPLPPSPETFARCTPSLPLKPEEVRQVSPAPASTPAGWAEWRRFVRPAALFLRAERRDVQLLLALPHASRDHGFQSLRHLDERGHLVGLDATPDEVDGTASAFVQLAYPWLATGGAEALPGGAEPPDGVLAGVLAHAIPRQGVARSAGRARVAGVHGFTPELPGDLLDLEAGDGRLAQRVSLIGPTPDGVRLLSDVTTSLDPAHRPASVGRLTAAILRAARPLGLAATFEPAGPRIREQLRNRLEELLADFHAAGALHGATPEEAYSVRCDDTTMTPQDVDQGRILAEVRFSPAHPIGQIVVILSLREGAISELDVLS